MIWSGFSVCVWVACLLYILNMCVGLAAQFRLLHLGWLHHALYALVLISAGLAWSLTLHPLLLVTLSALLYMPSSSPGTWKHPTAACIGLIGYVGWFIWP